MLSSQFFSVSDLQKKYSSILQSVEDTSKPAFLMKNNKPVAVVLSPEEYDRMVESVRELEILEAQQAIQEFEQAEKDGTLKRFISIDDILKEHDDHSQHQNDQTV